MTAIITIGTYINEKFKPSNIKPIQVNSIIERREFNFYCEGMTRGLKYKWKNACLQVEFDNGSKILFH